MLTMTLSLLCIAGSGVDVRGECLRKLSSHTPQFELGGNVKNSVGCTLSPDSEMYVESTAQLFGIHPFYIPRGGAFNFHAYWL